MSEILAKCRLYERLMRFILLFFFDKTLAFWSYKYMYKKIHMYTAITWFLGKKIQSIFSYWIFSLENQSLCCKQVVWNQKEKLRERTQKSAYLKCNFAKVKYEFCEPQKVRFHSCKFLIDPFSYVFAISFLFA